ncbi:glycosyltransferase [uncultured Alistipes sp.]|uniref:glycosyltransferase n=1 Tax=uncultured Alistipes sp. TaxID=538949 RepID=UPI00263719CA|nr:glycosyltransferase [uncultured Alistipes sp.]
MIANTISNIPIVSVLMPTYNHERYIAEAIESVLMQRTNYPYELVIGEDCSTDSTREICCQYQRKYPEIIHLLEYETNVGLMKNYQRIISRCKGRYFAILESDDRWLDPYKLDRQIRFLETHGDYGLVYSNADFLFASDGKYKRAVQRLKNPSGNIFDRLIINNWIIAGTVCFRRDLYERYVCLDDFIALGFTTFDYPVWLTLAYHSKFKYFRDSTMSYRIVESSISNNKDTVKALRFKEDALKINDYFIEKYGLDVNVKDRVFNAYIRSSVRSLCISKKFDEAARLADQYKELSMMDLWMKKILKKPVCLKVIDRLFFR